MDFLKKFYDSYPKADLNKFEILEHNGAPQIKWEYTFEIKNYVTAPIEHTGQIDTSELPLDLQIRICTDLGLDHYSYNHY